MSVHRENPLPERPAVGSLIVAAAVVCHTRELLQQAGARNPPHEGLVWWLGRQVGDDSLVVACHCPPCLSGPQFVEADEAAAGTAARAARARRLGIIAQVHSHPGTDTRHSDGDDTMVFMPYEGMFSLVVGNYGRDGLLPDEGAGLHQFQDHRWVLVRQGEPALIVVTAEVVS